MAKDDDVFQLATLSSIIRQPTKPKHPPVWDLKDVGMMLILFGVNLASYK